MVVLHSIDSPKSVSKNRILHHSPLSNKSPQAQEFDLRELEINHQ
jgi:hypothetical protein